MNLDELSEKQREIIESHNKILSFTKEKKTTSEICEYTGLKNGALFRRIKLLKDRGYISVRKNLARSGSHENLYIALKQCIDINDYYGLAEPKNGGVENSSLGSAVYRHNADSERFAKIYKEQSKNYREERKSERVYVSGARY